MSNGAQEKLNTSLSMLDEIKSILAFVNERNKNHPFDNEVKTYSQHINYLYDLHAILLPQDSIWHEFNHEVQQISQAIDKLYFKVLFTKEDDQDVFLDIQSGSGGIDSNDWSEMLMRMYMKYVKRKELFLSIADITYSEVQGIRSCTLEITGKYAYGLLKSETGIHRLVRKSPFDSNHKRHTSFSSVYVYPKINKTVIVQINPQDIRIDTFKASGAGGQHVNKTDSAVRIVHLPTHITVQCQNDRSQHKNKEHAMQQLMSKLHQFELKKLEKLSELTMQEKKDITWGQQIRSYVLDQSRIKDLRTNIESKNIQKVLDGDIDIFVHAYLKLNSQYTL